MDTPGLCATSGTATGLATVADSDHGHRTITDGAHHLKAGRDEGRDSKGLLHRADSFRETNARQRLNFIKSESEPILNADNPSAGLKFARRITLDGLSARFQRRVAQINKAPWLLATSEDFRSPRFDGQRWPASSAQLFILDKWTFCRLPL